MAVRDVGWESDAVRRTGVAVVGRAHQRLSRDEASEYTGLDSTTASASAA